MKRLPRLDLYWDSRESVGDAFFKKTMARDRFQLILRFLHFSNNATGNKEDKLYKLRPVLDHLLSKFQELYSPHRELALDEGMMAWRGRLQFRCYLPNKPVKWGVKSFILADSRSGYCYRIKPYVGERSRLMPTIDYLMEGLYDEGYHLFMDNYYNSVAMCDHLLERGTHVCGTLRRNRGEPAAITKATEGTLKKGETVVRHNKRVLVTAWRDKKIVRSVSTMHTNTMVRVEERKKGQSHKEVIMKPESVHMYNQFMNGVDKLDQMIGYYPFTRKTMKWYKKYTLYLFSITLFNSHILYKAATRQGKSLKLLDYLVSIAESWGNLRKDTRGQSAAAAAAAGPPGGDAAACPPDGAVAGDDADADVAAGAEAAVMEEDGDDAAASSAHTSRANRAPADPESRLSGDMTQHKMVKIPPTATRRKNQKRCRVCYKKKERKETVYMCGHCKIPLCRVPCFHKYHYERDYTK